MYNARLVDPLEPYYDIACAAAGFSSPASFRFYLDRLFGGIAFTDKRVLDIGGGSGAYSFYAAAAGAKDVVCLEPVAAGAPAGITTGFQSLHARLPFLGNVRLEPTTLQSFEPRGLTFDVIIMHASINHLDEDACVHLLDDEGARGRYRAVFRKIALLSSPGARLVAVDCSRYNFFALLGLRNPFSPDIEWHKHQSPHVWARLLAETGFVNPRITWNNRRMRNAAVRLLLGNRVASYFQSSQFCLRMELPGRSDAPG